MSDSEWSKVDYDQFLEEFGNEIIVKYAPTILYSKRDKEHEAYISLIAFFFIAGGLLIYIAITYFLAPLFFSPILFSVFITIGVISAILLMINYLKSNVYIKPLECWFEVFKGKAIDNTNFYCFSYYPIFSGECHPNEVKNVVYKMYQEEVLKSKITISQIEVYLKLNTVNKESIERIGYFFQYGEGHPFKKENVEDSPWKFFPFNKSDNENFLAIANWTHQYEWKDDLEYDFDKLHQYAPWVIQRWNEFNLKPLTEDFKGQIKWSIRNIDSLPKLKSWEEEFDQFVYQNPKAYDHLTLINNTIKKIIGIEENVEKIRKVKDKLLLIKAYFRDLNSKKTF
ncbi:MAG: hypothetical protein ACXAC5_24150 [Promethearchaeota archaeon]|jgi:hypothetical protein